MKPRHHLYLDDELTTQLEALSAAPGSSKSAIVADALRQYLRHKARNDQDEALKTRLDRLSRHHERLERDINVLVETLTVFVRYYLLFTAHLPDPDNAARANGRERFEGFIARVGSGLATGKPAVQVADVAASDGEKAES